MAPAVANTHHRGASRRNTNRVNAEHLRATLAMATASIVVANLLRCQDLFTQFMLHSRSMANQCTPLMCVLSGVISANAKPVESSALHIHIGGREYVWQTTVRCQLLFYIRIPCLA